MDGYGKFTSTQDARIGIDIFLCSFDGNLGDFSVYSLQSEYGTDIDDDVVMSGSSFPWCSVQCKAQAQAQAQAQQIHPEPEPVVVVID